MMNAHASLTNPDYFFTLYMCVNNHGLQFLMFTSLMTHSLIRPGIFNSIHTNII